jgi:hypothetical protein
VTNANFRGLSLLCEEFRFVVLSKRLSAFRQFDALNEVVIDNAEVQLRFSRWSSVFRDMKLNSRH